MRPSGAGVRVSARSVLVLRGDVVLEELDLDGTLVITEAPGAKVRVRGLRVANAGWDWVPLSPDEEAAAPEEQRIRGFKVVRHEAAEHAFTEPGEHVLSA